MRLPSGSNARISWALVLSSALLISSCGGSNGAGIQPSPPTLRLAASARGLIVSAAAATPYLAESDYSRVLGTEYNGLTAEWEMKFTATHPRPNLCCRPLGRICPGACHAGARAYARVAWR